MTGGSSSWDVVVVGAGVGGMALATRLGRLGHRVVMVERRPPPGFRVGESLDWEAPIFLRRLGLPVERLVAEGKATVKRGAVVTSATQPSVEVQIGFSPLFRLLMALVGRGTPTIHANREKIDVDLINTARAAGVELIVGRARGIEIEAGRVARVVLDDGRGLAAKFYVDATGRPGLFLKAFGIGHRAIGPRKVVIRGRFPHPYDGMGTRIRTDDTLGESAWIWDINVSEDLTDIGVVLTGHDFARLRRRVTALHEVFLHQVRNHSDLSQWLEPLVSRHTELWTCSFQDLVSDRSHGDNWIAVGEAAFVVDALLSSGFTMSLRTGWLAAEILADALAAGRDRLDPHKRRIYHEKTAAHVETINRLIEVLWYRGRLRDSCSLMLNVVAILAVNFNLNHLHTRYTPRTLAGLKLLRMLHKSIDALLPIANADLPDRVSPGDSSRRPIPRRFMSAQVPSSCS